MTSEFLRRATAQRALRRGVALPPHCRIADGNAAPDQHVGFVRPQVLGGRSAHTDAP